MARRKPMSSEDRIALRQARFMGAALSAEEFDDSFGDPDGVRKPPTSTGDVWKGKFDAGKLLADLLRATGVYLPDSLTGGGEGKYHLVTAAMTKINELKSNGSGAKAKPGNPLIPGGGAKIEPMYMSWQAENVRLKMQKRDVDIALVLCHTSNDG